MNRLLFPSISPSPLARSRSLSSRVSFHPTLGKNRSNLGKRVCASPSRRPPPHPACGSADIYNFYLWFQESLNRVISCCRLVEKASFVFFLICTGSFPFHVFLSFFLVSRLYFFPRLQVPLLRRQDPPPPPTPSPLKPSTERLTFSGTSRDTFCALALLNMDELRPILRRSLLSALCAFNPSPFQTRFFALRANW